MSTDSTDGASDPDRYRQSPWFMRMYHHRRNDRLARQMPLVVEMRRRGQLVGRFGGRASRCPVRKSSGGWGNESRLRSAWLEGWATGWDEYQNVPSRTTAVR